MIRGVSGLSVDYLTSPTVPHHSDDDDDDSDDDDDGDGDDGDSDSDYDDDDGDDSDYEEEGACCEEFSVQFNSHQTQQM